MKWIKLKIYQGDQLLSEIETVESKYDNMINEVNAQIQMIHKQKLIFCHFKKKLNKE